MKTTIVCGMLGAGKTTFIAHFMKNVPGKAVVLVNDFGKAGIDGEVFSAGGIESVELPSGCVCCTLKYDLIATIEKITRDYHPDQLLIEPSGVASPSGVLEALGILKLSPVTVVGIVDATEFLELNHEDAFGRFFRDQLTNSDVILVNKTDLVDRESAARTVEAIEQMNPSAVIYRTVNCITGSPLHGPADGVRTVDLHAPHFHFDTLSLTLPDSLDFESVGSLFHAMSTGRYGDVVRAKALVNTLQGPFRFDLAFANVQSIPFEQPVNGSRLVIIGRDLKKDTLAGDMQHYA